MSGDNANNKKITSVIASQLYDEYQQDVNITIHDLSEKYGLVNSMIGNILHKRAWKSANKNKPNIDFTLRVPDKSGDKSHNKKITSAIARDIYKYRIEHKCILDDLVLKFGVTKNIVFDVLSKQSWKKATSDLPDIDFKKEGYEVREGRRKILTTHGRGQMYQKYKCRCDACCEWKHASDRKYRTNKSSRLKPAT